MTTNKIPEFEIPMRKGQCYERWAPDTLDIEQRARLAINGLTSLTDPEADYEIYFWVNFFQDPPRMRHDSGDDVQSKFMEALPLLRIITGSDFNLHVEQKWMEALLKGIGPDGLVYSNLKERPWITDCVPVWTETGETKSALDESVTRASIQTNMMGVLISAMTVYYLIDNNQLWKQLIEKLIQRLMELTVDKGDYCYFPNGYFAPKAKISQDAKAPRGCDATNTSWMIRGLSKYYRVSGYKPAKEFAGKLVNFLKDHGGVLDEQARFMADYTWKYTEAMRVDGWTLAEEGQLGGTFHRHAYCLLSILEYALATDDRDLMDFVKKGYEFAKTQGCRLVGFFPEIIAPYYPTAETCEAADMITLALKLSEAGLGDYWDDVDRWVRNHFAEAQLTRTDWIDRLKRPQRLTTPPASNETTNRVAERSLGAFAGWATANDWSIFVGIMNCCTGNASRAIYDVWEHILNFEDGILRLNLLLNHASSRADIDSYIPYEGRVDLHIKQPCRVVLVRVPEWVTSNSDQVACTTNGETRKLSWQGRYVNAGEAKPGETIAITFPIQERIVNEVIGDQRYTLLIKGNEVVFIDPPGNHCPLYQRAHYRENQARWRKMTRFVPEKYIRW